MKDVVACDMLRGTGKQVLIRRSLNAETRLGDPQSSHAEFIGVWRRTQGTETSKYLEEKKETSIPSVAASESGDSPNQDSSWGCGRLEELQNLA